jgi:hypothetical protein
MWCCRKPSQAFHKGVSFGTKISSNEIKACAVPFCCPVMQP